MRLLEPAIVSSTMLFPENRDAAYYRLIRRCTPSDLMMWAACVCSLSTLPLPPLRVIGEASHRWIIAFLCAFSRHHLIHCLTCQSHSHHRVDIKNCPEQLRHSVSPSPQALAGSCPRVSDNFMFSRLEDGRLGISGDIDATHRGSCVEVLSPPVRPGTHSVSMSMNFPIQPAGFR